MNKKLLLTPILLLILLMSVGMAAAQEAISAEIQLDNASSYTVGDPLPLTLSVTHPAGYTVLTPELPAEWGDLTVVGQDSAEVVDNGDGTETTLIPIDARLFAPGSFQTPPLPISVTDGSGQLIETFAAPVDIAISSVLVEGDTTLRDIKPQAELPMPTLLPWIAAGTLLALIAGAALVWALRRRQSVAVDNRLPHEWAQDELARIDGLGYAAAGQYKAHYTAVADTVRIYLERTYDIPVTERTTSEVERDLRNNQTDYQITRLVVNFLDDADLVKFSTFTPTAESANALLANAQTIIEQTRPQPEEDSGTTGTQTVKQPATPTFSANGHMKKTEASA